MCRPRGLGAGVLATRSRRPEELDLEAAAVATVDADEVLDRAAVLQVRDTGEDEDRPALLDPQVSRDLAAGHAGLDRPCPAVELEAELLLVGLEQRAASHVQLEDRSA